MAIALVMMLLLLVLPPATAIGAALVYRHRKNRQRSLPGFDVVPRK